MLEALKDLPGVVKRLVDAQDPESDIDVVDDESELFGDILGDKNSPIGN